MLEKGEAAVRWLGSGRLERHRCSSICGDLATASPLFSSSRLRLSLLALLLPLLILSISPLAQAKTLVGRATHVRDGDAIVVDRTPIRLEGVAALELNEKWGRASNDAMQRIVAGKRLWIPWLGCKTLSCHVP
ncbi:MAG: hypothetical protein K9L82_13420 [Chromatiaceae bacterium]|nr:hypothetical protein [Chromatiaceae bacterium]